MQQELPYSAVRIHHKAMLTGKALGDAIAAAIEKKGVTKADLARHFGVKPPSVQDWIKRGTVDKGKLQQLWAYFSDVAGPAHWGLTAFTEEQNVQQAESHRRVPIISWVQAGLWQDVEDQFYPGEADDWALAFDSLPGKNAFALRVVGDSMTNPIPGQRTFPEGTIIIVDPGRAAGPGDYVIAKDVQTQKATFKQLTTDGGRWFLRALNPAYPTIEIDDPAMRVIGRVIEFQTRGKL
jgi:SOS-response transcriptional repressor LexA